MDICILELKGPARLQALQSLQASICGQLLMLTFSSDRNVGLRLMGIILLMHIIGLLGGMGRQMIEKQGYRNTHWGGTFTLLVL